MNGIEELLKGAGTSLEETRALFPKLLAALKKRKTVQAEVLGAPQFLSAEQARELGVELAEGWMLKVSPAAPGALEEYTFRLRSPKGEELGFEDVFETETGQWLSRAEKELLEKEQDVAWTELADVLVPAYPKLFPEYAEIFEDLTTAQAQEYLSDLVGWAQENPEAFMERVRKVGVTPETEALLRYMGATEEEMKLLLPGVSLEDAWKAEVEPLTHVVIQRFGFMGKAYEITWEIATMPDWARAWTAGVGDLLVTAGGASRWLGENQLGENLSKEGYQLQLTSPPDTLGEFEWSLLFNPRFYTERFIRYMPTTAALIPAAIVGAYAGLEVAALAGLGKLGAYILAAVGAASLSRPMESALEAGGAYDAAISKGLSPEEARKVADEVFVKNLALVGVDAAQFAVAFAPTPFKVPASLIAKGLVNTTRIGGKVVIVGLSEGGEEVYQDIIQRMALGQEVKLDAEMQEAFAIGMLMGFGLGFGGDVFTSIRNRTIRQLPEDLKLTFDKSKENFQRVEGLSEDKAELKALDEVADTEEGQSIIDKVVKEVNRENLLSQVKPKNETEQFAWEHMFKDFPEARAIVEKPITLDSLRQVARIKGYTITELTVPISRRPDAKFRISGAGVRVYARNLGEVENFMATGTLVMPTAALERMKTAVARAMFEASKGEGYFTDALGFKGAVNMMSEAEVRDMHAMFVRTGRLTGAEIDPMAHTAEEITELKAEVFGLEEWLMTEPATRLKRLVRTTGRYKGEVTHLTLKEFRDITGTHMIPPSVLTRDKRHVRWEYSLDFVASEMGYETGEDLKDAIENLNVAMQKVKAIKADLASITPEEMEEINLRDDRRRALEAISEARPPAELTDHDFLSRRPAFVGKAYRVHIENWGIPNDATVADIVRFERDELGNEMEMAEELLNELDRYHHSDAIWVTKRREDAGVYLPEGVGEEEISEIDVGLGAKILLDDQQGGYLVLLGGARPIAPAPIAGEVMPESVRQEILNRVGTGAPGLSSEPFGLVYRSPEGRPVAVATLHAEPDGKIRLGSVVSEGKSLLVGRAAQAISAELQRMNVVMPAEIEMSPQGLRIAQKYKLKAEPSAVPRGTVRHASQYKGIEDFNAEVMSELFHPIKDSPLDVSASAYWREGDFDAYVNLMPSYSELKLNALTDEVRKYLTELQELLDWTNKTIESLRIEVSLTRPGAEEFQEKRLELSNLEHDASNIKKIISELTAGNRLTIDDAAALGIALRMTKGGNLVPAIRRSGFYVTTDFAEYQKFKDVHYLSGRAMDTMTLMEAVDGGYTEGAAQRYILWGTERTYLASSKFIQTYHTIIQEAFEKFGLVGNKKLVLIAFDVIQKISAEEADFKTASLLLKPEIKELIGKLKPETQTNIVEFAQWTRAFLDDVLRMQNEARAKRGQPLIKYREDYLPWVAEKNVWSMFGTGHKTPAEIFRKPPAPDYIVPDAPFNARAMAREGGMAKYLKERDVHRLLFDYVRSAGKDIFYTNIIQNAKIHVAALRSMGYENSARLIEDWVSEAYGGVKPSIEKAAEAFIPMPLLRGAYMLRRNLTRAVFPLNWLWNLRIQPSSIAFTVGRTGVLNTMKGLDYLFVPSARAEARQAYSWIIKSKRSGKMAYQDIGAQVEKNLAWEGSFFDKVEHIANFITNTLESLLTGISIRAGHHYGQHLGFEGRALLEYASKMGAKTQSMYNYQDVPALLRAKPVGTLFPFQTFCFQAFNYIREMNFVGVGKAGAYHTISAKTAEGQATIQKRVMLFIQFLVAIWLINLVVDKTTNRKPWVLGSFIPFYSNMVLGTDAGNTWNLPLPAQYAAEFWNAFEAAVKYDNYTKLRRWVVRYHVLGGTQLNKMWDGLEAVLRGGVYDVRGTEMFEVRPEEWLQVVSMGVYQSQGGREYIDKIEEKRGKWYEYFKISFPSRVNIGQEIEKNLAQLGQVDDTGQVYNFADFVSDLREMRRSVGERRFDGYDSPYIRGFLEAEESRARYEIYVLEHWDGLIPEEIRDIGKEPGQGSRDEWRALHPEDDARLAMWGFGGRIQTQEAYDLVKQWCAELGIPLDHLSAWLPPEEIAGAYFNYIKVVNDYGGSSAEARLIRLENLDFNDWGKDAYGWKDIETPIEALLISVKWREMDKRYGGLDEAGRDMLLEANPDYADDRRRRDAFNLGLGEAVIKSVQRNWLEDIVNDFAPVLAISKTAITEEDRALLRELSDVMGNLLKGQFPDEASRLRLITESRKAVDRFLALEGITPEEQNKLASIMAEAHDFLEDIPYMSRDELFVSQVPSKVNLVELYVEWFKVPKRGYEDDWFLLENRDFYTEMVRLGQLKERDFSEVPDVKYKDLWVGWEDFDKLYADATDKKAFLSKYPDYADIRRSREAVERQFPDELIETFVGWYKVEKPEDYEYSLWYEDDWYLMEHEDFYHVMFEKGIWTEPRDFSKVPTREVWKLYKTYLGLPKGQDRLDYRVKHPDLDAWLVNKFGYNPASDRGDEEAKKTVWEKAEEARRIQEWLDRLIGGGGK